MAEVDEEISNDPEQLKELVKNLREKNKQLSKDNVITLQRRVEIIPPGYYVNMKRLKSLEGEVKNLHQILEFGNISTLQTLIETYKALSKVQLGKIMKEYQFYFANKEDRSALKDLICFLESAQSELKKFLLNSGGE